MLCIHNIDKLLRILIEKYIANNFTIETLKIKKYIFSGQDLIKELQTE